MEIVKNVHLIRCGSLHASNVYFIASEKPILIDTGMPENADKILDHVSNLGFKPSDVSTILLTHFHLDHCGSSFEIKKRTGARIAVHSEDADFVSGKKELQSPLLKLAFRLYKYQPVRADLKLKNGDRINGLTILHTPGHTPGSVCVYEPKRKILFTGDALRMTKDAIKGPYKLSATNIKQAVLSAKKILSIDFRILLPGHGHPLLKKPDRRQ